MRFSFDSNIVELLFLAGVLALSFFGSKIKNFFESLENEESHRGSDSYSSRRAKPLGGGASLPNRGANYRELPKRRAVKPRATPVLDADALGDIFVGTPDTIENLSAGSNGLEARRESEILIDDGAAKVDTRSTLWNLHEALADRESLERAVLLSEILDKPLALRGGDRNLF